MLAASASRARSLASSSSAVPAARRTGQVRLFGTAGGDELRAGGDPVEHDAQHVMALRLTKLVEVVHHEDERARAGTERCGEARGGRPSGETPTPRTSSTRSVRSGKVLPYAEASSVSRICGSSSKRSSETHGHRAILGVGPLGEEGRLAVAGGRGHPDDAALARPRPLDEPPLGSPSHPGARAPRSWRREGARRVRRPRAPRAAARHSRRHRPSSARATAADRLPKFVREVIRRQRASGYGCLQAPLRVKEGADQP